MISFDNSAERTALLREFAEETGIALRRDGYGSAKTVLKHIHRSLDAVRAADRICTGYASAHDSVPPEMEWLRDNRYLAEKMGAFAAGAFKDGERLSVLRDGRPFLLAATDAFVSFENGCVTEKSIFNYLDALQTESPLTEKELCLFLPAVCVSLVSYLADKCAALRLLATGRECGSFEKSMENIFTSLRFIDAFDPSEVFRRVNRVENILAADPSGVYPAMDDDTRHLYREAVTFIAEKSGRAEHEIASEILTEAKSRRTHVGEILRERGALGAYKTRSVAGFIFVICALSVVLAAAAGYILRSAAAGLLLLLPISEIVKNASDFVILKTVRPKKLPRIELDTIPDEGRTVCVISALLTSPQSASDAVTALEKYRLLNRDAGKNLLFGILADLPEAKTAETERDAEVLGAAKSGIDRLNEKYGGGFYLFTRPRVYNEKHGCCMGYERKRGAVMGLARLVCGMESGLRVVTGGEKGLDGVKFILTLDSDTHLSSGAAKELVGTALHPLNMAVVDREKRVVSKGYGILQPRVSIGLDAANRSDFTRIFAGQGGADPYGSVASDVYQDLFGEGIFSGKGLIDASALCECLADRLPENAVLSHDLIEGAYLRAGYVSDVEITDGFPYKVLSYYTREHRWIRGDWQVAPWLFGTVRNALNGREENPISPLSRWKIFDNLRRSLVPVMTLTAILFGFLADGALWLAAIAALSVHSKLLISSIELVFKSGYGARAKYYSTIISGFGGWLLQTLVRLMLLPFEAWTALSAVLTSLWRMLVSHRNLLQWVTAAEADRRKSGLRQYFSKMWPSVAAGLALILFFKYSFAAAIGVVWVFSPVFASTLSREIRDRRRMPAAEEEFLRENARDIWSYFSELLTVEDNYLPPDNRQLRPALGVAHRTSPTNIGLGLLSVFAACDLGLITEDRAAFLAEKLLGTVERMEKWNGHLYNWYDTRTLDALQPAYVSTVDSGNLACCLVTAAAALREYGRDEPASLAERLAHDMDFRPLFDNRRKLFYIGCSVADGKVSEGRYDLMSSEARLTSYFAVASGQVPRKHWRRLSRTLVSQDGYSGMVSWTGTMFEYLMPDLLLPCCKNSLLYESSRFCVHMQRKRAAGKLWGISESAFYAFDPSLGYKYKAHGVGRLALRRGMDAETVYSPYSAYLALPVAPRSALRCLKEFEILGAKGPYGLFEAVDFTPSRQDGGECQIVATYMAHHLGMSLLSIANVLLDNVFQRRFMVDTEMAAYDELLQEKVPLGVTVLRQFPRDVPEKPARSVSGEWRAEMKGTDIFNPRCVILTNGAYSVFFSETGASSSKWNTDVIARLDDGLLARYSGITFYLRVNGRTYCLTPAPDFDDEIEYSAVLCGSESTVTAAFGDFKTAVSVTVPRDENGEVRTVSVEYSGEDEIDAELLCFFVPVLGGKRDYDAHRAFSSLLMEFTCDESSISVRRRRRSSAPEKHLCMTVSRKTDFLISESEVFGRGETILPQTAKGKTFYRSASCDARVFASTPIALERSGRAVVKYSLAAALNASDAHAAAGRLQSAKISESASVSDLNAASLGLTHRDMTEAYALAARLRYITPMQYREAADRRFSQKDLWVFGISGDDPIAVLRADSEDAEEDAEALLRRYAFLGRCGFKFDLVIVLSDGADYMSPVKSAVSAKARAIGLEEQIGKSGGIHFADESKDDCGAIFALADVVVNPGGQLMAERNSERRLTLRRAPRVRGEAPPETRFGHGEFRFVCGSRLPDKAWSDILTNGEFGFIATDAGTGHMWKSNARENRVNFWLNDFRTTAGTETLELLRGDVRYSLFAAEDGYPTEVVFRIGSASWTRSFGDTEVRVTAFVPQGVDARVLIIEASSPCRVAYSTDLLLGPDGKSGKSVITRCENGVIYAVNPDGFTGEFSIASSLPMRSFTTDRLEWTAGGLTGKTGTGLNACAGAVFDVSGRLVLVTGFTSEKELRYLLRPENAKKELRKAEKYRLDRSSPILIETPDSALDNYVNSWALYQTEACRIDARTSIYQSGGAYGFRDQLQDACALLWTDPEKALRLIRQAAGHQYEEGDVMHWWHLSDGSEPDKGVRTRYSDDLLWLPYALCTYAEMTGDADGALIEAGFIASRELDRNEPERYEKPEKSTKSASLFEHARLACERALERGAGDHGLCRFGGGDWNDGMNLVGIEGRGESVWLTWFLSLVLRKMAALAERFDRRDIADRYYYEAGRLSSAADAAWDTDHYLRGFYDDGTPLGKTGDSECAVDSVAQSFSVPGGGSAARRRSAVLTAYRELFDEDSGIVKLLDPPFDGGGHDPGYIKGYAPGLRENGGQYCHAAVWLARALLDIGETDRGFAVLQALLPAHRDASVYKGEPFVLAADVYAAKGLEGTAGWTWYTGTAGWYYRTVIESLLGIRLKDGTLEIEPRLPSSWNGYKAAVRLNGSEEQIEVKRQGSEYLIKVNNKLTSQYEKI